MNNKNVLEFILEVEDQLKNIDARYERYFLIMRAFLYDSFRNKAKVQKKNHFNIFKGIFINFISIFLFFFMLRKKEIIISPNSHINININGKIISKHVEGVKVKFPNSAFFSVGTSYGKACLNLSLLSRFYYELNKKKYNVNSDFIKDFSKVFFLTSNVMKVDIFFSPDGIHHWLSKVECYVDFYSIFLSSNIKVKKAVFIAYYDLNSLGFIEALKRKKIECIDYQHGIQNNYHPMYSKISALKTSLGIPTKFWGWDNVSQKRISSELGMSYFEKVGNLWISTEIYKNSIKNLNRPKKTILVALQLWPNYFNNEVFDVISKNTDYLWVFREHPLNLLSEIEKQKILIKFKNVVFENIEKNSVEASINSCSLCMTGYSTVALEAFYMGKKSLFFHENAKNGLDSYIDNESVFYADNKENIQKIIDLISLEIL